MEWWTWGNVWDSARAYFVVTLPWFAFVYGFLIVSAILYWWVSLATPGRDFKTLGIIQFARGLRSGVWTAAAFVKLVPIYQQWGKEGGVKGFARATRRAWSAAKSSVAGKTHYDPPYGGPPDNMQSEARAEATPGLSDIDFVRRHG